MRLDFQKNTVVKEGFKSEREFQYKALEGGGLLSVQVMVLVHGTRLE